jgi:hypothetical protein
LTSSILLGLAVLGSGPEMPEAFWRVPAELRDAATVVVSGRFQVGRGPHEPLPDGRTRWALLYGFTPTVVYRGQVKTDYIGVESRRRPGAEGVGTDLREGREYLLLLRPSEASTAALRRPQSRRHPHDALTAEEVLAIVEIDDRAS